nr:UvrD-helicase domain-containing protein [Deinobacterium chartae]
MRARAASAGTGKTTAIVGDFLRALEATPVRRMAVVTFTRAGATDLRLRLEAGLRELIDTGRYIDYTVHRAALPPYRQALTELGGATISTIHGFFRRLLYLCAPDLHLDPFFVQQDELESGQLFLEACSAALSAAVFMEGSPGAAAVAELGWDGALSALLDLRAQRTYGPFQASGPLEQDLLALYQAAARLTRTRQAGRTLDPDDVEEYTLRLVAHPGLLARVRERYTRVFVDEFQDVSPLQARIFEALDLEVTQLVGDAKQSIYAFRNADVNAFLELYGRSERLMPLTASYRHGPALARLYSRLCAEFFPDFEEQGLPGEVTGKAADACPQPAELILVNAISLEEGRRAEGRALAARLLDLEAQGYRFEEMAVLVRSRGSLPALEAALRAAGIPYAVQGGAGFYGRREVRDAALLLEARPQAGAWLYAGPPPHALGLLAALAQLPGVNAVPFTQGGDWEAYLQANPGLEALLRELSSGPRDALRLLEALWASRPLALTPEAEANLEGLLHELASRELRDPATAARFLRAALNAPEADEPVSAEGAVRIMTVHASKGLEFKVAAVFDLSRAPSGSDRALLVHPLSGELAYAGSDGHARISELWRLRREGEDLRLLYVALTRARERLILTGSLSRHPRGWVEALASLWAAPPPELRLTELQADEVPAPPRRPAGERVRARPRPDPELALARPEPPPPALRAPSRHGSEALPRPITLPAEPEIPDFARVVGVLVHAAIAANTPEGGEGFLRHQLILTPYPPEERDRILEEVGLLLAAYRRLHPEPARAGRLEDHAELPFAFREGSTTWNGVIDRLYLEEGRWVLEDYKTDLAGEAELETLRRHYAPQMAVYREGVRRARPEVADRLEVRLSFLRAERTVALERAELDAAWQRVQTANLTALPGLEDAPSPLPPLEPEV